MGVLPGVVEHGAWPRFGVGLSSEQEVKQVPFFAVEGNSSAAEELRSVQELCPHL